MKKKLFREYYLIFITIFIYFFGKIILFEVILQLLLVYMNITIILKVFVKIFTIMLIK
jgi:hypothetical protein